MAYKQKNYFEFRDSLAKGEPDKVIKGKHFDEEFGAIEKAFENVTADIHVDEIEGLDALLNEKADQSALEEEIENRIKGDEHLQSQIDNLEPYDDTQIKQDLGDLDDKIEQEITDRGEADKLLQGQIDDLKTNKADQADLLQEIKDRENADKDLQLQIDALDTGKADLSALNQEIKDRQDGDNAINDRIDNLKVNDLADTKAQSPSQDDFLIFDGTDWVAEKFHIDTELQFKGGISVPNDPAPAAEHGDLYINNEEGVAGASWTGIAGRQINPANAVGWSSTNNRWYMLGDIATSAVTEIKEGTAIKVDASPNPSTPTVSLDKALTNTWYAHQVTSKTDSGINVSVSVDSEGYVSYDVSADIRELGEDFAPADKAYMYTDQPNVCSPDFTIDCQKTTITGQAVSAATIEGEYFSARLDDSFFNIQNGLAFTNRSGNALFIDGTGEGITAPKIKKVGGTAEQLLCADGSVATKTEVGGKYQLPDGKGSNCTLRFTGAGWVATDYLTIDDEQALVRTAGNLEAGLDLTANRIIKNSGTANQLLCADGSVVDKGSVGAGQYTLPLAANSTRGGFQTGYATNAANRNYAVQMSGEKAFVNVPWTDTNNDTTYSQATSTTLGLVKIGATGLAAKNYAVALNGSGQMYVAVPWTDTQPDLTGYATEAWVNGKGYLTSASLNGYATETWVTTNHYKKTETKKNVVMTEAQYNSLGTKDAETVYFLT